MRAVADDREAAQICGINPEKIILWTFVLGSGFAVVAGILMGLEQNLEPNMGMSAILKGITAAIVGGIGSVSGGMLGGFILGFAENFGIWFLPSGYKDAIAFVILVLFLLFRPNGILGIKKRI
jgi:branched-subunit amino acid ABC-type transport system permease component